MSIKKQKITDLVPDDVNFNTGTEFGNSLIEKSLSKFGAGRSILIDKHNRIIAGNKTVENAAANGFENIVVVETDGKDLVAVKRTDIDLNTKQGREMALADNATAKANISWDADNLTEWEMPTEEWGIVQFEPPPDLEGLFVNDDREEEEDKDKIVLHYTADEIELVKAELLKHGKTYESAVWVLCGL